MSTAPMMPLFPDAYLADTTHLTTEEHGAYLLLLMAMWRRGGTLLNDDADLARIVRLAPSRWRKTKARLLPLLSVDGGELTQKRLKKEWEHVSEKRQTNAKNGRLGGRPKANINNRLEKANGYEINNPKESPHYPDPISQNRPYVHSHIKPSTRTSVGGKTRRTYVDVANEMNEELDRNDQRGIEESEPGSGGDVLELPPIGPRRH
jgi:uncharacterized protein YdaU (DUF1376 family)